MPEEADEFLRIEGKREAHFVCHVTSVTGAVPAFIEIQQGFYFYLFILLPLKCNVTTFFSNENEQSATITNHAQSQMYSLSSCAAFQL